MPQPETTELKPAPKIFKETCEINWNQPAKSIYDFVRGLSPYPGAWTNIKEQADRQPLMLKLFRTQKTGKHCDAQPGTFVTEHKHLLIATSDEWLEITELQLAGKKRMNASDFLNGMKGIEEWTIEK